MIAGTVNDALEAIIRLTLQGPTQQQDTVEAVIDPGFDGYLTLPSALVARLGLPWRRKTRGVLADGSERVFDIHEGTVVWNGRRRRIAIDVADTAPLVGMALLYGSALALDVVEGGAVVIKPLTATP